MEAIIAFLGGGTVVGGIALLLRGAGNYLHGSGDKEVQEAKLLAYALKRIDELQRELNFWKMEHKELQDKYENDLKTYQDKIIRLREDKLILTTMLLAREPNKSILNNEYRQLREEIGND